MTAPDWTAVRTARPVRDLARATSFYRDLLGLAERGGFTGHDGYDGVFLGLPGGAELELTRGPVEPGAGTDDLLVLYLPTPERVAAAAARLAAAGVAAVRSANPYWERWGRTFLDPDGHHVVLAAVETTRRFRTPPLPVVYAGILAALALAWVVRPEYLLGLPPAPRLLCATALAFLPVFLANIAFAKRFADTADSQEAFAVNLLGAIVGGCLEYAALLTGYDDLLIVTAVIYLIAFGLLPRAARPTAWPSSPAGSRSCCRRCSCSPGRSRPGSPASAA